MPPVSSPGNVHADELAEELREPVPADPALRPAAGRVGRPGDRPAQAVLPLGEERVVARRSRGRSGPRPWPSSRCSRGAAGSRRRARAGSATARSGSGGTSPRRSAGRRPAGSPSGRCRGCSPGSPPGRTGRRPAWRASARNGFAPPPAPTVESVIPAAFIWARICVVLARGRPAVGQQDDVAARRGRRPRATSPPRSRPGEDVRLAERLDPADRAPQVADRRRAAGSGRPSGPISSKATTPSWSRAVIAAAARRIASLPMSTLRTPAIPGRRRRRG